MFGDGMELGGAIAIAALIPSRDLKSGDRIPHRLGLLVKGRNNSLVIIKS